MSVVSETLSREIEARLDLMERIKIDVDNFLFKAEEYTAKWQEELKAVQELQDAHAAELDHLGMVNESATGK